MTLPTEAQWEYAYRAGTTTTYYDANAKDPLALGWFKDNAGQGTKPVGQKKPNPWGLYDMGGNVWQWCLDWYAPYSTADAIDPMQTVADASDKPRRVLRGGSWLKDRSNGRAAARFRSTPGTRNADNGFRLVILDKAPVLADATPPPAEPRNPSPVTTNSAPSPTRDGGFGCFGALFALPFVGAIIFVIWKVIRTSSSPGKGGSGGSMAGISLRPGKDGFWIHANPSHVGAHITVNYRSMGTSRVARARVEHTTAGQFVYTGYAPETLELVHVSPTGHSQSNASQWSSSQNHSSYQSHSSYHNDSSSSSSSSSFDGYPPAY
jgi:formylglycine-generating enzyme